MGSGQTPIQQRVGLVTPAMEFADIYLHDNLLSCELKDLFPLPIDHCSARRGWIGTKSVCPVFNMLAHATITARISQFATSASEQWPPLHEKLNLLVTQLILAVKGELLSHDCRMLLKCDNSSTAAVVDSWLEGREGHESCRVKALLGLSDWATDTKIREFERKVLRVAKFLDERRTQGDIECFSQYVLDLSGLPTKITTIRENIKTLEGKTSERALATEIKSAQKIRTVAQEIRGVLLEAKTLASASVDGIASGPSRNNHPELTRHRYKKAFTQWMRKDLLRIAKSSGIWNDKYLEQAIGV